MVVPSQSAAHLHHGMSPNARMMMGGSTMPMPPFTSVGTTGAIGSEGSVAPQFAPTMPAAAPPMQKHIPTQVFIQPSFSFQHQQPLRKIDLSILGDAIADQSVLYRVVIETIAKWSG
jgi:hypothetical protein